MFLQVRKGCFSYNKSIPLLHEITFSLDEGDILAVMGQNGVGKTTLLKCLLGILKWQSGKSEIVGHDSRATRRLIGYVPQARRFSFPYLVRDMVVFGRARDLSFFAAPTSRDYRKADEALDELGILQLRDKSCNQLSGGQLQLVLMARALVGEPRLLILDEPESHLDCHNQFTILKTIKSLAKEKNITCIMNTHYLNHALRLANKCLLLADHQYLFGNTHQVFSPENIRRYFAVDATILETQYNGKNLKTIVVTDELR
jgi:iron complex transport system ATP-binding protein